MEFFLYTGINVTINILGSLILIVLIITTIINGDNKTKQERAFFAFVVATLGVFLTDIPAWLCDTAPGEAMRTVCIVSNFLEYTFTGAALLLYTLYIHTCISAKGKTGKHLIYIVAVLAVLYEVLIIATQFNGMVYSIDENNVYTLGPWFVGSLFYAVAVYVLNGVYIFLHRKDLGRKGTFSLLSYVYFPLIALFAHFYFPLHIMTSNVAFTLAILVIYVAYQMQEGKRLKLELAESRTAVMLGRIQPHFLYNALGAIDKLVYVDSDKAHTAIITFSDYLRGNMDSLSQKELIPFQKELEHTRQYLWLEQLRFKDRLNVEYDIAIEDFMLPVLTLQPIVENAVRWGVTKQPAGGTVTIRTVETERAYRIVVQDDGAGYDTGSPLPQVGRSHTGIANVRNRLAAMCGGRLTIESTPGTGTTAIIEIPKQRGGLI